MSVDGKTHSIDAEALSVLADPLINSVTFAHEFGNPARLYVLIEHACDEESGDCQQASYDYNARSLQAEYRLPDT